MCSVTLMLPSIVRSPASQHRTAPLTLSADTHQGDTPCLVLEVAYSQTGAALRRTALSYLHDPRRLVHCVIGIDLPYPANRSHRPIRVSIWRPDKGLPSAHHAFYPGKPNRDALRLYTQDVLPSTRSGRRVLLEIPLVAIDDIFQRAYKAHFHTRYPIRQHMWPPREQKQPPRSPSSRRTWLSHLSCHWKPSVVPLVFLVMCRQLMRYWT